MALRDYEQSISLDTLYEINKKGGGSGSETLTPYISIKGGTVDIYAITSSIEPIDISDLELAVEDTGVTATKRITTAVRYIAIKQNTGTTSEIILSGIEAQDLGAI